MLSERMNEYYNLIRQDVLSLQYVGKTDFFNFFPKSEQDEIELIKEAEKISKVITESVRGHYRKFNTPVKTEFGEVSVFKIRPFDPKKTAYNGAPDFIVREWDKFIELYKNDPRFIYFQNDTHPTCKGYIFQTETHHFCFCNPPVSDRC